MESASCAAYAVGSTPQAGDVFVPWRKFHGFFVPEELAKSRLVSPGAKLCWAALARHAGQDGECFPRQVTLAAELGRKRRQVQRYIGELCQAQLIRVRNAGKRHDGLDRRAAPGLNECNRYEFLWHRVFEGAIPLKTQDATSTTHPDTTEVSCPDTTEVSLPLRESLKSAPVNSIDRAQTSSEAKTKTTPAPARWPWPAEDVEQLRTVIQSYELRDGRHPVATDELLRGLMRKAVYYLTSPLAIAHLLEQKRVYVSHRPSCVPETERWFYRVVEAHFAGLREVEAAARAAPEAAPRMPPSSEMAAESAALVASVAAKKGGW